MLIQYIKVLGTNEFGFLLFVGVCTIQLKSNKIFIKWNTEVYRLSDVCNSAEVSMRGNEQRVENVVNVDILELATRNNSVPTENEIQKLVWGRTFPAIIC